MSPQKVRPSTRSGVVVLRLATTRVSPMAPVLTAKITRMRWTSCLSGNEIQFKQNEVEKVFSSVDSAF